MPGFPNIACNGSNINPVAMNILNIKLPNGQYYIPTNTSGNFLPTTITDPATYEEHQLILNGDYVISSKNTLAMRYLYTNNPQTLPLLGGLPGAGGNAQYSNTDAVIKLTTLITPSMVNELRGSFQRNFQRETDTTPATPQALGITPIIPQETEMTPFIIGNTGETIGGTLAPSYSPTTQIQIADQVSWSHGRHTFRAGYEYEETQWNITFRRPAAGPHRFSDLRGSPDRQWRMCAGRRHLQSPPTPAAPPAIRTARSWSASFAPAAVPAA